MTAVIDKTVSTVDATATRVLIVNSPLFGAVSLSGAWVSNGQFKFSTEQPPAYLVEVGDDWLMPCRWTSAVAVSLPDGVHILDATEVQVALHLAGEELMPRMSVDQLTRLLVQGVSLVGVEEIRRISAAWSGFLAADARKPGSAAAWRREMRKVWGSRKRMDRSCLTKCMLLEAVRGRIEVAA